MQKEEIKKSLEEKGWVIIPNILSKEEVEKCKDIFKQWQTTIPDYQKFHNTSDPHGIHKYHEAGHQEFSWRIRTNPDVQKVFKDLWGCQDLVVSFDGSCYISKNCSKTDNIWTHSDQAPSSKGLQCYQGFVALTDNKERTLVVYEGSHKLHEKYFADRNIKNNKNWQLIDHDYLDEIKDTKKTLHVPAGALVLWESRVFHQNQYGKPFSEERMVQYVCFFPKTHEKNTKTMQDKRKKYFNEKRTTSHWPCPIRVNSKQTRTFGDDSKIIDYTRLTSPNLNYLLPKINKLL